VYSTFIMPVSPLPQAPHRQDRKVFPTPLIGDVLFSEVRDCNRILIPEYGTPHPDTNKWPDHKLVYVRPVDIDRNEIFEFFYAANRENQDLYNFEYGTTQIGGLILNTVARTYITLRSEFDSTAAELVVGATMPNVPVDKFEGTWILYNVEQKRIGQQELDSLFVVEQRIYVQPTEGQGATYGEIVTTSDSVVSVVDEGTNVDTGIDIISSQITPLGNGKAVKVTKEVLGGWPDPVEKSLSNPPEGLPPSIVRDNLIVTTETRKVGSIPAAISLTGNEVGKTYKRETPDRVEEEVTTMSFSINAGLLEKSVNRTAYLITSSESTASDVGVIPAIGDGSYSLIYRAGELEIYRNTVVTTEGVAGFKGIDTSAQAWGSIIETTNYTLDSNVVAGGSTRLIFKDSMTTVYESSSVAVSVSGTTKDVDAQAWGTLTWNGSYATTPSTAVGGRSRQVWSNGVINVYLNENHEVAIAGAEFVSGKLVTPILIVTEYTAYATSPSTAPNSNSRVVFNLGNTRIFENQRKDVTPTGVRDYAGVINYSVPPVFLGIEFTVFEKRDGTTEKHMDANIKEGFSGAMPCAVKEYYSDDPPTVPATLVTFKPEPISFTTPFGSFYCPPTLHGEFNYDFSTGTVDPVYKYIAYTVNIPATSPADYEGQSLLVKFEVNPYEEGYIVQEYTINL
jgi:hypothetical protein